jgi:hypothetical protein
MNFHPNSHIVNSEEITELEKLGYKFYIDAGTTEGFINLHFPNFNITQLLSEIDSLLSPLCTAVIYRQLFLKDLNGPELTVNYFTANYREDHGLALSRILL